MNRETIEKAVKLSNEISRRETLVNSLKEDIEYIQKGSIYNKNTLSMDLDYSEYSSVAGTRSFKKRVVVSIPKEALLKIIKEDLYVANNLLNRDKLELEKL